MDLREKLKSSNPFKASQSDPIFSDDDTSNQNNAYNNPTQQRSIRYPPKGNEQNYGNQYISERADFQYFK